MALGTEVGLGPSDIVLDGDPALTTPKKQSHQFSTHVYCGQTTKWIMMALGTDVGLGSSDILLYGDPAPPLTKGGGAPPPQFSVHVYCGQTTGWIKMALGTEVDLSQGHIVLDGDPAPSLRKEHSSPPPVFGPCLNTVAISATAELLFIMFTMQMQCCTSAVNAMAVCRENVKTPR